MLLVKSEFGHQNTEKLYSIFFNETILFSFILFYFILKRKATLTLIKAELLRLAYPEHFLCDTVPPQPNHGRF